MECDKNSNVLEFDFKMGQFLKDFFIPRQCSELWDNSKYIKYVDDKLDSIYLTYKEYSPPILEINYPNGNFEDEYKYIYIQCPKITNFLQNCFTNRITGNNSYIKYFEQNAPDFISPVFKIADTNDTTDNIIDTNNNQNKILSLENKSSLIENFNNPWLPFQIVTPTAHNLNQKINISTNKNYYMQYDIRNKNKLFVQLDLNYNNFALLLHSIDLQGTKRFIFNDSHISTADMYNSSYIIRNFQFTKISMTDYNLWYNLQSQQINIGEILNIPIQIFISKEVL